MKKVLSLILALCLLTAAIPMASAETTQFYLTQKILEGLDSQKVKYTYGGVTDSKENEYFYVDYSGEHMDTVSLKVYVNPEYERIAIYSYYVIRYNHSNYNSVLRACNQANSENHYVKFYCDESDDTVTAQLDGYVTGTTAGTLVYKMLDIMSYIIDDSYNSYLGCYDAA